MRKYFAKPIITKLDKTTRDTSPTAEFWASHSLDVIHCKSGDGNFRVHLLDLTRSSCIKIYTRKFPPTKPLHIYTRKFPPTKPLHIYTRKFPPTKPLHIYTRKFPPTKPLHIYTRKFPPTKPLHIYTRKFPPTKPIHIYTRKFPPTKPLHIYTFTPENFHLQKNPYTFTLEKFHLQLHLSSEMPQILINTRTPYIGITLVYT